jgi:hypothetical protein
MIDRSQRPCPTDPASGMRSLPRTIAVRRQSDGAPVGTGIR